LELAFESAKKIAAWVTLPKPFFMVDKNKNPLHTCTVQGISFLLNREGH
jgi:hypothetical protein